MFADPTPVERPDAPNAPNGLNEFLRQVVATFRNENRSDAELLALFATTNDQDAFRALVGRHGRSVWAACLAVAGDGHDAEDAFQAVFVALARRAAAVDAKKGIGPWLRAVARRAALKVRRDSHVHRLRARAAADVPAESREPDESHAWVLTAEELEHLPRRLREPLVMYHLEGRTFAQVAELLGCSVTETYRRVERGLERLRTRLSARGVALTTGMLAAIPAGLVVNTASAAAGLTRGGAAAPRVATLAEAILAPRFPSWPVAVGAALLMAGGTALALVVYPAPPQLPIAGAGPELSENVRPAETVKGAARPTAALTGRVTDAAGRPVPGADVLALVRRPWLPGDRGLRDDVVARARTDAAGRYVLVVPADFPTHYPERAVTLLVTGPGLPPTTKLARLAAGGHGGRGRFGGAHGPRGSRRPGREAGGRCPGGCGPVGEPQRPSRCRAPPAPPPRGGRPRSPPTRAAGSRSRDCRRARTCGSKCSTSGSHRPPFGWRRTSRTRCGSLWPRRA
ncbi:sigma-70 family RNA polymerase sigma factor [Frigoriglobus tundricola]|uniref:RNA polymerase sigma-70 region 2 domain-containing protein n=1 Tax=Frigoriglobus tundricola TaxID=2774151 RepID=A0A6M5YZR9_9BACT|nr:sigma-70 family RNA polymerase sigma factor [Frigoriglobus tundricola]QJW99445.1 hypothetical protein FTUN_7057 [Frigoriglobus tundricola]